MIPRYSREKMSSVWSPENRYQKWLDIEILACEAMAAKGDIPAAALKKIKAKAGFDVARIDEIERETKHDVIAFLTSVTEKVGPEGRFIHMGLTSSDILDTSLAVLLKEAAEILLADMDLLLAALKKKAFLHKKTLMIGRSHGIHAEPIAAGLVFAGFFSEVGRARRALVEAREQIAVGKIAGAVGTYANLTPDIEHAALASLGLRPEVVPTQIVARDRHAGYFMALARLGTAIERIALTVRHWQRTEVGEASEAFGKGQKGSSAMPHKKNPILSENLCGLARLLRAYAASALEDVALWHERDISHSSVERVIGPDATGIADFMVRRAAGLIEGLVIYPERMARNLAHTGGLYFSEGVMLALVRTGLARQTAYEMVQKHALATSAELGNAAAPSFRARLGADPEIAARLSAADLDRVFDLRHHLRWSGTIIDRALQDQDL